MNSRANISGAVGAVQLCLLMQVLATTSHYSLSRLLTRISHLHFTIYYLILHLVRYFFSLKNFDRLRSRKGTTADSNGQRDRRSQQLGPLSLSLAPWQWMEPSRAHVERRSLQDPLGNIHVWGQFEMSQTTILNLFIRAAFLAAFAVPVLQSWLAVCWSVLRWIVNTDII